MQTLPTYPYPTQLRIAKYIIEHPKAVYALIISEGRSYNSSTSNNWCTYSKIGSTTTTTCVKHARLTSNIRTELQLAIGLTVDKSTVKPGNKMTVEVDILTYYKIILADYKDNLPATFVKDLLLATNRDDTNLRRMYSRHYWNCTLFLSVTANNFIEKVESGKPLKIVEMQTLKDDLMYMRGVLMRSVEFIHEDGSGFTVPVNQRMLSGLLDIYPDINFCLLVRHRSEDLTQDTYCLYWKGMKESDIFHKHLLNYCDKRLQKYITAEGVVSEPYTGYVSIEVGVKTYIKLNCFWPRVSSQDRFTAIMVAVNNTIMKSITGDSTDTCNVFSYLVCVANYIEVTSHITPEVTRFSDVDFMHKVLSGQCVTLKDFKRLRQEFIVMGQQVADIIKVYNPYDELVGRVALK